MKGFVRFVSTTIFIVFGILIIWWFKSAVTSEVFIVSSRHRESFSTLNYLELAKKTLEEASVIYSYTGAATAGSSGGVIVDASQKKDGISIWASPPDGNTVKETLRKDIVGPLDNSLQTNLISGKFLTVNYKSSNVRIENDNSDYSKSSKFFVKGEKNIEILKQLTGQAINIKADLKGVIDNEITLKYFALYDAAKQFLNSHGPENRINSALGSINTAGTVTHQPSPACGSTVSCNADHTCPAAITADISDPEVLQKTDYYKGNKLTSQESSVTGNIEGLPFTNFKARFDEYGVVNSVGYDSRTDYQTGNNPCTFTCTYQVTTIEHVCTTITNSDGSTSESCNDVPVTTTYSNSCPATVKTKTITFTFLTDMYSKYSSEDPKGFVPSRSIKSISVVSNDKTITKSLPYDTLKFNYMVHSCSVIKTGQAIQTDLKEDSSVCQLPADIDQKLIG